MKTQQENKTDGGKESQDRGSIGLRRLRSEHFLGLVFFSFFFFDKAGMIYNHEVYCPKKPDEPKKPARPSAAPELPDDGFLEFAKSGGYDVEALCEYVDRMTEAVARATVLCRIS